MPSIAELQAALFPEGGFEPIKFPPKQAKAKLLQYVELGHSLGRAAKRVGISPHYLRKLMSEDLKFAEDIGDAYSLGTDYLEDLAFMRAHENDQVLIKLLESRRPEKYSARRNPNANITIQIANLATPTPETPAKSITIEQHDEE